MKKTTTMQRTIMMLAIIGTLIKPPVIQAEEIDRQEPITQAKVTFKANGETQDKDYAEGEVYLTPEAVTTFGDGFVKYTGTFRLDADSDGDQTHIQTIAHKVVGGTEDWDFTLGRNGMREFGGTTTTMTFDNDMANKGLGRTFTGGFVGYKPWGLTLGIASSDGTICPSHWDMLVGSWSHRFDDRIGVQTHVAATKDAVEKAGVAMEWTPTDRFSILMDCVYGRKSSAALIAADLQASRDIMVFAGAEATMPKDGDATGKVIAGVEGNLGHGCKAIGAVEQGIGPDSETKVVFGFKFKGSRDFL